jgi:hypothetical protein
MPRMMRSLTYFHSSSHTWAYCSTLSTWTPSVVLSFLYTVCLSSFLVFFTLVDLHEQTVIVEWTRTLYLNVSRLTGRRAGPEEHQVRFALLLSLSCCSKKTLLTCILQRVLYLICRSRHVRCVQNLSVYHVGDNLVRCVFLLHELPRSDICGNADRRGRHCLTGGVSLRFLF